MQAKDTKTNISSAARKMRFYHASATIINEATRHPHSLQKYKKINGKTLMKITSGAVQT